MKTKFLVLLGLALLVFFSGCTSPAESGVGLKTTKNIFFGYEEITLELSNNINKPVFYYWFYSNCTGVYSYVKVLKETENGFKGTFFDGPMCKSGPTAEKLEAGEKKQIKWQPQLKPFMGPKPIPVEGTYKIAVMYSFKASPVQSSPTGFGELLENISEVESNEFEIRPPRA